MSEFKVYDSGMTVKELNFFSDKATAIREARVKAAKEGKTLIT